MRDGRWGMETGMEMEMRMKIRTIVNGNRNETGEMS